MSQTTSPESHELLRGSHRDEIEATMEVLKNVGIAHRIVKVEADFDYGGLGKSKPTEEVAVMVDAADAKAAREALEEAFASGELPENHFLSTATDDDLIEVLSKPQEWSAFDVSQARRLAAERGLELQGLVEKAAAAQAERAKGRMASSWMMGLGWLALLSTLGLTAWKGSSLLHNVGAMVAVLVGQHLGWTTKENGEDLEYDKRSSNLGRLMVVLAVLALAASRYLLPMKVVSAP